MATMTIVLDTNEAPDQGTRNLPYLEEIRNELFALNLGIRMFSASAGPRVVKLKRDILIDTVYEWRTSSKEIALGFCKVPDELRYKISIMLDSAFCDPQIDEVMLKPGPGHRNSFVTKSASSTKNYMIFHINPGH